MPAAHHFPRQILQRTRAFALVDLLLAMVIVVLAAALASTLLGRQRQHARVERCGADLQAIAGALEKGRVATGHWPAPSDTMPKIPDLPWAGAPSPVGGHYGWIAPTGPDHPGAVALTAFIPDLPLQLTGADLLELDSKIDDGDLTTGRLRAGFNGWPVYLVEEKP